MTQIKNIHARQIIDSRGTPTLEVDCLLDDGSFGRAAVQVVAHQYNEYEALELRDNFKDYFGKSVLTMAIQNVNTIIRKKLMGNQSNDIYEIDKLMLDLDNTDNKSNLGANAMLEFR